MGNQETQFEEEALQTTDDMSANRSPGQSRGFIEVLVDPKTLTGLMLSGGGLLVVGLVVWLWSVGVFENRTVVASCLGAGNFALLASGIYGVLSTRYQTAGKAVTLLACLIMPLNLWFYDAQGLITLDQGGHLWVPALVCCAIYAGVARLLREPRFAYAIVGGITMTGLLFLADQQVARFWEIMAPSTFLVVVGMVCIHGERVFPDGEGPFSRKKFGQEFFRAGHVVLAAGLVVLLAGRLCVWLYEPFFAGLDWFPMPVVTTEIKLKLYALALALSGAYSYVYSLVVVRSGKRYFISALLTLLWSAFILLDLLAIPFTMELVTLIVAVVALVTNALVRIAGRTEQASDDDLSSSWFAPYSKVARSLAVGLNMTLVSSAAMLYGRDRIDFFYHLLPYEFSATYFAAVLVGGAACWLGLQNAHYSKVEARLCLQGLALLGMFGLASGLACLGVPFTVATLTLEMALPMAVAVASLFAKSDNLRQSHSYVAEVAGILLLLVGACATFGFVSFDASTQAFFGLAVFFGVAAANFGLASVHTDRLMPSVLVASCTCAATWLFLNSLGVTQHGFFLASAIVGTTLVVASEISTRLREQQSRFALVSLWTGRVCITCGGVAIILMTLARLLTSEANWSVLGVLGVQMVAAVIVGILSRPGTWRRHFLLLAAVEALIGMLVVNALSTLSFLQRGELFLTATGLLILAAGYYGWYRETDDEDDVASINLALGSLLCAVPMTLGLLLQRFGGLGGSWGWVLMHEAGVLVVGLVLLGTGVLCRIRWSTLIGSITLGVYVISLVGLLQLPERLQTTAVYMMAGGGLFFVTAVLLSVYRDRLLALPKKVQGGEGVFRVFKWR